MNSCSRGDHQLISHWLANGLPNIDIANITPSVSWNGKEISYKILKSTTLESDYCEGVQSETYLKMGSITNFINSRPFPAALKTEILGKIEKTSTIKYNASYFECITTIEKWISITFNIPSLLKEFAIQKELLMTEGDFKVLPKEVLQILKLNHRLIN